MGVLRYFPGSEPRDDGPEPAGSEPQSASDPAGGSGPADAAHWAVPGLDPAAPEPVEPPRVSRRAENVALVTLTRHDTSEAELRAKLAARGVEQPEIDTELDRLKSVGLIDDAALASRLVQSLRERKGLGDGALRPALRARHLPQDVIDAVLAEARQDEEVVHDRLQEVADDRARRLTSLAPDVAERRLISYLMRKGYSGSAVRTAARNALQHPDER
jgi:regulatory protein